MQLSYRLRVLPVTDRPAMPSVYHYCPSITRRDAIGYSLTYLHKWMLRSGLPSYQVCDRGAVGYAPSLTMTAEELEARRPDADDILIFHHSFLDGNAERLMALRCRKVMVYHNITPGHFFREWNQHWLADTCDLGRKTIGVMRDCFDEVVADSAYNAADLTAAGYPPATVIPVFFNSGFYADGTRKHDDFIDRRTQGELNIVFIGRFVPNKRPDQLIRMAQALKGMHNGPVRLRFHGKVWDTGYFHALRHLSEQLGVETNVSFEINQPQAALRTSLSAADAFVSMSEHEGFMVPLIEAFAAGCPVVAVASSAVTETCGDAGLVLAERNPELVAATILAITRDRGMRRNLVRQQAARAVDFDDRRTLAKWSALLEPYLGRSLLHDAHRV